MRRGNLINSYLVQARVKSSLQEIRIEELLDQYTFPAGSEERLKFACTSEMKILAHSAVCGMKLKHMFADRH